MKKRWEVQQQYTQGILNDKFVDFITSSKKDDTEKKMSLSFAITLIVAVSTISYRGYTYLQSNAVSEIIALILIMMFSLSGIILVLLSLFIFLRGFSIELEESPFKSNIISTASKLYKSAFIIFALLIPFCVSLFLQLYFTSTIGKLFVFVITFLISYATNGIFLNSDYSFKWTLVSIFTFLFSFRIHATCFILTICFTFLAYYLGLIGFFTGFSIAFFLPALYFIFKKKYIVIKGAEYIVGALSGVVLFILIIYVTLHGINSALISQSHINIEMADSYDKNDTIIYGALEVFGLNEVMNLNLSKIYSNNTIKTIDSVVLEPIPDSMYKGEILYCNYLNDGDYSVYINMSNQSPGYYKLSTQMDDSMKPSVKVFLLR